MLEDIISSLTASTSIDKPETIVKDDDKWQAWRSSVLSQGKGIVMDPIPYFEEHERVLKEVEAISLATKFPGELLRLPPVTNTQVQFEEFFTQDILDWAKTREQAVFWDDNIPPVVMKLFLPWLTTYRALETDACELMHRTLVDAMLRLVFAERTSDHRRHIVREEQDVLLPVNPRASIPLLAAKADSIVCAELDEDIVARISIAVAAHGVALQALCCVEINEGIQLGTFFGQWKRDEDVEITCRQAAFFALGIQSHRRALGLQDRYVYGLVQTEGFLHLVTSYWTGPSMVIRYWDEDEDMAWDLRKPSRVVECFYFLCALKEHIDREMEEDMKNMKAKLTSSQFDLDFLKERDNNWWKAKRSRASTRQSKGGTKASSSAGSRVFRTKKDDDTNRYRPDPSIVDEGGDIADSGQGDVPDVEMWDYESMATSSTNAGNSEKTSSDSISLTKEEKCGKILSIMNWREGKISYMCSEDDVQGVMRLL